jgi:hypothetical protein
MSAIVPLFASLRPTTKRRTWDADYRTNITTKTEGHVQYAALHSFVVFWRDDTTDPALTYSSQTSNMSCLPESQDCNACPSSTDACQSAPVGGSVDIEDYTIELAALKARMRTLESKLSGKISEDTKTLRSWQWLNRSDDPGMSALYLDRYLNYGLTEEELSSHKPIIGIAQSGSDLAPCNRHHLTLAKRVREGIRSAGGIAIEFPTHPIQETSRRPTATLDRNLSYLGLVELLHGYPFDGVVLLTGCDKTTPACTLLGTMRLCYETDEQLQVSWRLPRSTFLPYA